MYIMPETIITMTLAIPATHIRTLTIPPIICSTVGPGGKGMVGAVDGAAIALIGRRPATKVVKYKYFFIFRFYSISGFLKSPSYLTGMFPLRLVITKVVMATAEIDMTNPITAQSMVLFALTIPFSLPAEVM